MSDQSVKSLLNTLKFLDSIGDGEAISNIATDKKKFRKDTPLKIAKIDSNQNKPSSIKYNKIISAEIVSTDENILKAKSLASSAKNLSDLKTALEAFNGCDLKNTAMNTVFADGQANAKIMLIGEAPGADEDIKGLPFVGLSGQLLDKMFKAIGYSRSTNLYITNVIPWRPPGNRTPTTEEINLCLPFLNRHIELINPVLCILVGGTAVKAILKTNIGISKIRGQFLDYITPCNNLSIKISAIFHPSYLLRSPGQKKHAWTDLQKIRDFLL